ncbi:ATP-binding protein [Paraburkholderia sp. BCC1876]|uniref:ATP-binding protein n=1 Tax=Paraburkholderia sp. BCC1876 TaxID=2676303 RepID=UPI0015915CD4|nr:ATP-binding protein [Paraburkholderia sp. BCC1876]
MTPLPGIVKPIESRLRGDPSVRDDNRSDNDSAEPLGSLPADLNDSRLLHELSLSLLERHDLPSLYAKVVETARVLMSADFASLQMLDMSAGEHEPHLHLLAHSGFTAHAADHWRTVLIESTTSCGESWATGERVVVADIEHHAPFCDTVDLDVFRETGIKAMQSTPLRSRDGAFIGMISTHWGRFHEPDERQLGLIDIMARLTADLIERARSEDALRLSEARLRALVTATSYSLYRMSPDWKLMRALDGRGFLRDTTDVSEDWVRNYIHAEDQPRLLAAIQLALDSRSMFELEHRVAKVDGTWGWAHSRAVPLFDADGKIVEWFGAASDVTARVEAEHALRESREKLLDADRMKDQFLATLAHELRNPLAPVRHGLQILRCAGAAETSLPILDMLDRQVDHMVRLVDDLMEVARINSGALQLSRTEIDVEDTVRSALELSRPLLDRGGHALHVRYPPERLYVHADQVRLTQVLSNLLNNAARYTPSGGRIELEIGRDENRVVIRVSDNGNGLAATDLPKLFRLFERLDAPQASGEGLGVGLALAKRLMELQGGDIAVESPGRGLGSTFTVHLPIVEKPVHVKSSTRVTEPMRFDGLRVLIVDDNVDSAMSLGMLLDMSGCTTRVVHSGADALEAVKEFEPRVAVLDIGMPDMDGIQLARELRARTQLAQTSLVALTGWGQADDRVKTREAGFECHLVKPVSFEQLCEVLCQCVGHLPAQITDPSV